MVLRNGAHLTVSGQVMNSFGISAAALTLLLLFVSACGGGALSTAPMDIYGGMDFPDNGELGEIAKSSVPKLEPGKQVIVDQWTLDGELPEGYNNDPAEPSAWYAPFDKVQGAESRKSLACVARQVALFDLKHRTTPSDSLTEFIGARCGVPSGQIHTQRIWADNAKPDYGDHYLAKWPTDSAKYVEALPEGAHYGLWTGFADGRFELVIAYLLPKADIEPVPFSPDADKVTVKGRVRGTVASIDGFITQGAYGAVECSHNSEVKLPDFEITCPLDRNDGTAWFERIKTEHEEQLLGRQVLNLYFNPNGEQTSEYSRPIYVDESQEQAGPPRAQLLGAVNRIRAAAGQRPLALDARQSDAADEVAPHYFAASFTGEEWETADRIARGLMAGWRVEARVRRGNWSSQGVAGEQSFSDALGQALQSPYARHTLLDEEATRLAVGQAKFDSGYRGIVVTTYRTMDGFSAKPAGQLVLEKLNKIRKDRGLDPVVLHDAVSKRGRNQLRKVTKGEKGIGAALSSMGQLAVKKFDKNVFQYRLETADLDDLNFPTDLLTAKKPLVGLAVGHVQGEGAPWAHYVVFITYTK